MSDHGTEANEEVVRVLRERAAVLRKRFGVEKLFLFGSAARGEAGPLSDVDLLVELSGPAELAAFLDLADHLEACLGRRVDLVTTRAIRPRVFNRIRGDLVRVA